MMSAGISNPAGGPNHNLWSLKCYSHTNKRQNSHTAFHRVSHIQVLFTVYAYMQLFLVLFIVSDVAMVPHVNPNAHSRGAMHGRWC